MKFGILTFKLLWMDNNSKAKNRHLPPNMFLLFLAELDIFESYETNLLFFFKIPSNNVHTLRMN